MATGEYAHLTELAAHQAAPLDELVEWWEDLHDRSIGAQLLTLRVPPALGPDRVEVLGADHPETLISRSNLAYWTREAGDGQRALAFFEALLPDREALGAEHPDTLAARDGIDLYGDASKRIDLSAGPPRIPGPAASPASAVDRHRSQRLKDLVFRSWPRDQVNALPFVQTRRTVISGAMRTIVLGANPDIEAVIARRRHLGQDLFDEVWEGEYHMAPAGTGAHALLQIRLPLLLHPFATKAGLIASGPFNLGEPDDFRVPDIGYHRTTPVGVWHATAAIVVEIVSPDDETYAKLDFYLAHGVDEIIVADPAERSVRCFRRAQVSFVDSGTSLLLGIDATSLAAEIDWP